MLHIRKIKTLYGLKYAVVDLFTYYTPKLDRFGNQIKKNGEIIYDKNESYHAVEYGSDRNTRPAIFPLTESGLQQAKEVQDVFKKGGKKQWQNA